jgi:hypothetical protein
MSKNLTLRSLAVRSNKEEFEQALNDQGIDEAVLSEAMEAASSVLERAGARAVVEDLRIVHTPQRAGTCRCIEYETLHLPVRICTSSGCRTEYRTTKRCVRWACD